MPVDQYGNILSSYNTLGIMLNIYLNCEIYKWDNCNCVSHCPFKSDTMVVAFL